MGGVLIDDDLLILGVRAAGVLHFVTLAAAWFTPIPPDWDENLALLPQIHRRFAVAQNAFTGATIAFAGIVCLLFARELVSGPPIARLVSGGIALLWGGRLAILPWLGVGPHLKKVWHRVGFALLVSECAIYACAFGWLALRA